MALEVILDPDTTMEELYGFCSKFAAVVVPEGESMKLVAHGDEPDCAEALRSLGWLE